MPLETSEVVGEFNVSLFFSNQFDCEVNNPFDISNPFSSLVSPLESFGLC